jgi:cathepsin B
MTDRICIASDGKNKAVISEAHLTACVSGGYLVMQVFLILEQFRCFGGVLFEAYTYYQKKGLVTGGEFNSSEGCVPYPFKSEILFV